MADEYREQLDQLYDLMDEMQRNTDLDPISASVIGHDTTLGDYSHVYSLASIGGGVRIGAEASIFPGARVVPRVAIGKGATVGIGSTVIRDVDPGITVFGSPAERFRIG